jgi:hypothetical protein
MSILCAFGGHEAGPGETYNCGYWFSRCRRCRRDMIRSGAAWATVPRGHRVVWRHGRGSHSLATDFAHVLPVLHPAANLPMVKPRFASWSRQLVGARKAAAPAPEAEPVEAEETPYPPLLVLAAIVGGALQLLLGLGAPRQGLY